MAASDAPPREDAAAPAAPVVTASDVASYLLKRGNIASAFEYYQDLIDATSRAPGGDDDDDASSSSSAAAAYAALEAYFADQRRFPSAELREHADVVDIPGLVATARELASRVAVAEYDARVAAEDAATARAELEASRRARALGGGGGGGGHDDATEGDDDDAAPGGIASDVFERVDGEESLRSLGGVAAAPAADGFLNRDGVHVVSDDKAPTAEDETSTGAPVALPPMRANERRALNVLVNEYLLSRGYRAAALSLRDDVDRAHGDALDDWSGAFGGRPPGGGEGLRKVLRRARTIEVLDPRKLSVLEKERDGSRDDANDARRRAEDAERRRDAAEAKARALEEEATSLRLRRDEKEADAARWRARAEEAAAAAAAAEEREERRRRAATAPPSTPTAAVAAVAVDADWTPALVGAKSVGRLEAVAEEEVTIGVLCDALPRVALHVLVQRRGELLPLFQRAIARCPEPERRAGLTALLFALIKRPGADQRRVIADACANIASIVGDERTAEVREHRVRQSSRDTCCPSPSMSTTRSILLIFDWFHVSKIHAN